jgi:CheY-like chemotaxis protein
LTRVIFASEDAELRERWTAALESMGCDATECADGQTCLEESARVRPHLVFVSGSLPVHDGFAVCSALRGDPDMPDRLPIFIISSEAVSARDLEAVGATQWLRPEMGTAQLAEIVVAHQGDAVYEEDL